MTMTSGGSTVSAPKTAVERGKQRQHKRIRLLYLINSGESIKHDSRRYPRLLRNSTRRAETCPAPRHVSHAGQIHLISNGISRFERRSGRLAGFCASPKLAGVYFTISRLGRFNMWCRVFDFSPTAIRAPLERVLKRGLTLCESVRCVHFSFR